MKISNFSQAPGLPIKAKKKPVIIEAVELTQEIEIETREGTLKGYPGDFLIKGIEGEIYPCGREIFRKTYDFYRLETPKP